MTRTRQQTTIRLAGAAGPHARRSIGWQDARRTVAVTGRRLSVVGGPVTVVDATLVGHGGQPGGVRLSGIASIRAEPDNVDLTTTRLADSLAQLAPTGAPYVPGSKTRLIGERFEAGASFVPLLELEHTGRREGGEASAGGRYRPEVEITYVDRDGESRWVTVPVDVELRTTVGD